MKWTRLPVVRQFHEYMTPRGHVDALTGTRVVGWALGRGPLVMEVWLDGRCLARGRPQMPRLDVAHFLPERTAATTSGFALDLPVGALASQSLGELRIVARYGSRWLPSATIATLRAAGDDLERRLGEAGDSGISGPFPKPVIDAIAAVWPEDCEDLGAMAGQARFARRLAQIVRTPGINALPAFASYTRYLAATWAHCRFVERHFPATNRSSRPGAADFHCKPNSVRELFAIIHQLYVLRSWGVAGEFAEFGCFKGYSSAMLSFACAQLGLRMHIFDSFEGLPPAPGSGYTAGDYAGSLDEVRDHVTRFGAVECVSFHKGFFADTFRRWRPPPLMCLWMDVDLEVSARDLMVIADGLDPRGTIFSHECEAGIFRDGKIVSAPAPDNPIAPMLDRHDELGRPLTGHFIAGYSGAFWPKDVGIPVVHTEVLWSLLESVA
ncbi:class I SAM-dependent methyltransferase [uncultured Sphingomonas sp.]|uniref:class I SAM-dependent methyltransferase n=1 Tax=uncultured Sphingomonas sp. TaxID=158754 RepID=UPI0035CA5A55